VSGPAGGPVVVGIDDGLLRMPVLDAAVAAAHCLGRGVHVIHGHGPVGDGAVRQDDAGLRAEAYLRRTAPGLEARRTCAEGEEPAETLAAAAEGAALLVLGDRSRRPGSEAGRTTDEVMIRAACPVLVIGEYREVPGAPRRHAVIVGVDGSAHGRVVLGRALDALVQSTAGRSAAVTTRAVADRPASGRPRAPCSPGPRARCWSWDRPRAAPAPRAGR
jgi:nucleotide-binding universal stress UspA family protein